MKDVISHLERQGGQSLDISRREFFQKGMTVAGWGALFLGAGAASYECVQFFYPSVVFHPPSIFQIGKVSAFLSRESPDSYGVIFVDSHFKEEHRFFVIREVKRIYALFARCTHLGCTVNWFPGLDIFKCPCHGSEFRSNGKEFAGPAPRPLDRLKISLDMDENILVDTRTIYTAKEFEQKKAYIEIT